MWYSVGSTCKIGVKMLDLFTKQSLQHFSTKPFISIRSFYNSPKVLQDISTLQIKKRPVRKKMLVEDKDFQKPGVYNVFALTTADEYNLDGLKEGLVAQNLYDLNNIDTLTNVLHVCAKYQVSKEPREIFFFKEGSIVFWNFTDLECGNVIDFLKPYEKDNYSEKLVQDQTELMKYYHKEVDGKSLIIQQTGEICIAPTDNLLEKYTFSNILALSVKLGIWETTLDKYIDSIEYVTEDLKKGAKIKMSIEDVLKKHGELYGLRHLINLSSDLLDTPDFYWEHEELEHLYSQGYAYFSIRRRTQVINEKINHCIELIELLSRQLTDRHHVRLEWMIIVLIMAAVVFESLHYADRYWS